MEPSMEPTLGNLPFSLSADELRQRAEEVLRDAEERLDRIETLAEPRTVANTLEPLDRLLLAVADLRNHCGFVFVTHPEAANREAGRAMSEAAERFFSAFRVRRRLYDALRTVDPAPLDAAGRHALDKLMLEMRRAGVELDAPARERLRALSDEIDQISNQFSDNLGRLVRTFDLSGPAELRGLPDDFIAAHPPDAAGKVHLTTRYPDSHPVLAYAESPELRRRMLMEFLNRAYPENLAILDRLLAKRREFALALGYPHYAEYAISDKMMGSADAARAFIERMGTLLRAASSDHLQRLLERKRRDQPGAGRLEPWDGGSWGRYYDVRLRSEDFGVDPKVLREYLPYVRVRDGLLGLCERLFGIRITPISTEALWHPTVEAYDVSRDGRPFGRFYLDLVPREGKYGHAAQFEIRVGIRDVQLPQAALVCNFLDPGTPKSSARMEYGDVITFFHEFGHLLHSLFAGHGHWLFGTQGFIEFDFVEVPSQLFEEWARDPATLGTLARHPETGAPIPPDILNRLRKADGLGRANSWMFQLALSAASLGYYDRDCAGQDSTALFDQFTQPYLPIAHPAGTHPQASWGHLTGYSAFYYAYVWSAVIARDLLGEFLDRGSLTDPQLVARYAEKILAPGSSRPAAELVRDFLGREFRFDAFERWALQDPYHPSAEP